MKSKLILTATLFLTIAIAGCTGGGGDTQTDTTTTLASKPTTTTLAQVVSKPPIADAGDDQTLEAGNTVTYDASGSSDPDGGSIVSYEWTVVGTPSGKESAIGTVVYSGADAGWTTPWTMKPGDVGQWTTEVKVTDDEGETAVDSMVITITEATGSIVEPPTDDEPSS